MENKTTNFIYSNRWLLSLLLLFFLIYLLPLGVRPLAVPDEMRYGEIARELLQSNDWVVPHLNGLRYFEKPMLGHALNALGLLTFGENAFGVRIASALSVGISALALFFLVRQERDEKTAFLASFFFLTMAEVMGVGTVSVLDSMVSMFITLSLCAFYFAQKTTGRKEVGWLAATGACAGLAFLVKGFIAFAVPVVVIIPFLLWQKQGKRLFTLPWIPLIFALLVALPWSLAIAAKEPDFWHYFFWEEHIRRFFSQTHAQHDQPFWYFIPIFLLGAMPWILIAPLPLRQLFRPSQNHSAPLIRFAWVWVWAPFLFFSLSAGKLGTYILPCFPPLAILLALGWRACFEKREHATPLQNALWIFTAMVLLASIVLLVFGGLEWLGVLPQIDTHFLKKFILATLGFSTSLILLYFGLSTADSFRKTLFLGLSALSIFISVSVSIPSKMTTSVGLYDFLLENKKEITSADLLIGDPKTTHAICFVFKRDDLYIFRHKGEFKYGLSYPESKDRYLELESLQKLIQNRQNKRLVLLIKSAPDDRRRAQLPAPDHQVQWLNIWLAVYEPHTP